MASPVEVQACELRTLGGSKGIEVLLSPDSGQFLRVVLVAREALFRLPPALCGIRRNTCFVCQQGLHMHQHMLPLINKTPSEAALTFASCLRISEPISHHIVPPTCMSRQPNLSPFSSQHSHSASLPPLSASILASPQRPHDLLHAHTPTQTHKPLHLPLPTR